MLATAYYVCLAPCFFPTSGSLFTTHFCRQVAYPPPHCLQPVSSTSSQSFSTLPGSGPPRVVAFIHVPPSTI